MKKLEIVNEQFNFDRFEMSDLMISCSCLKVVCTKISARKDDNGDGFCDNASTRAAMHLEYIEVRKRRIQVVSSISQTLNEIQF